MGTVSTEGMRRSSSIWSVALAYRTISVDGEPVGTDLEEPWRAFPGRLAGCAGNPADDAGLFGDGGDMGGEGLGDVGRQHCFWSGSCHSAGSRVDD
jgi:hypothetical protein